MTTSVLTQGIRVTQKKFPPPPKAKLFKSYIEVGERGAISDYDETQGREQDFAEVSSVKGKQHVSSKVCIPITLSLSANLLPPQAIVVIQKPSKPLTKFTQLDLPDGLSYQKQWKIVIPMVISYFVWSKNPWECPSEILCGELQAILVATVGKFQVVQRGAIYYLYVFTYLSFIY